MKRKEYINILIIILLLSFSYYRYINRNYSINRTRFLMDTQVEISITSKNKNIEQQLDKAFSIIELYDNIFSYYNPNSLLYHINNSDSLHIRINDDLYNVLVLAGDLFYKSGYLYDVTIAPLSDIWNFDDEIIPDELLIKQAQNMVGFDRIGFTNEYIYLPEGMKINLGSISKGYIIDKIIDYFIESNILEGFVNAGGDLRFYSNDRRKWRIGIQNPRDRNSIIMSLRIPDMAVVTSGDYERYFINNDIRYHHILNPLTGFPATPTVSVTILSQNAFLADALSTAAFVMNPFDAIELIKTFNDTEAVIYFYDDEGEPISLKTEGIKMYISD